jgi:hypothetical protein
MAKPLKPEPKFFLRDDLYAKGLAHYSQTWFAGAGSSKAAGEKSTDYLESAPVAERIARDLPGVRLVFILREPVDRAYSNYLWTKMNGLETESFATAIRREEQRERELPERLRFTRPYSYFSRGLYADLLAPYFQRFPPAELLVARYEDIRERPAALAESLHRFLGVASRPGDVEGLGVINPAVRDEGGAGSSIESVESVRRELAARYVEPNRRLAALLGPSFPMWAR